MPYPSQIDKAAIAEKARQMIEEEGVDALSLAKLAAALGVKAPSFYRHVKNKAELLEAVSFLTIQQLIEQMKAATVDHPTEEAISSKEILLAQVQAFRRFAHANPRTYVLAFTARERGDEAQLVQLVLPRVPTIKDEHSPTKLAIG